MRYNCLYNEKRDIQEVVPNCVVDLNSALKDGVIKDTGVALDYNDIKSPSEISGRCQDVFDAIDLQKTIVKNNSKSKPNPSTPTE